MTTNHNVSRLAAWFIHNRKELPVSNRHMIARICAILLMGASGVAFAQDVPDANSPAAAGFDTDLQRATDVPALEALLQKNLEANRAKAIVAKIENLLIADIQANGVGGRFVIADLRPAIRAGGVGGTGSVTLKSDQQNILFNMELPDDRVPMVNLGVVLPMGPGSVHRFDGTVCFKPYPTGGLLIPEANEPETAFYKFSGTGDPYHRLTFYLTKEYGYVYLRGMGEVTPIGGGQPVKLGEAAKPTPPPAPTPKAVKKPTPKTKHARTPKPH